MALTTKTNGQFESAAALVPAPYGALTRVGDIPDVSPNSHMPVEVTSSKGVTLYISYDQMTDAVIRDKILAAAHSTSASGMVHAGYLFHLLVQLMYHHFDAMDASGWYTYTEWAKMVHLIRFFQPIAAMLPDVAYTEYDELPVDADFTSAVNDLEVTFTNTSTGEALYYLWDFGDNSVSIEAGFEGDEVVHTYGSAGAKTVRLIAVGPGGIDIKTASVTAVAP